MNMSAHRTRNALRLASPRRATTRLATPRLATPRLALLTALACLAALPARADGTFFQLDVAREAGDATIAVTRGRLNYTAGLSRYPGGQSAGVAVLWSVPFGQAGTLKIGPSFGRTYDDTGPDESGFGAKISYDRWSPTSFGHLYLLAEYNSIDNAYFGLVQTGFGGSGYAAELSVGGSDRYSEITAAVTKRIGDGPLHLRAGYRFEAETAFVGFAINTF